MNFEYYMPTRMLFGYGSLKKLHEQKLPYKKALIVTTNGKSVIKYGYLAMLMEELDLMGIEYAVYSEVSPNPELTEVTEGAEVCRENGCDFVIGLGGGSPIDCAKAIAVMAVNEGNYWDYNDGFTGKGKPVPNKPLPIVAVTTTAGTGTEVDPWTVTTNKQTNEKLGFGYDGTYPVLAVVDPSLMMTVPPEFTAYQGFDAFFHASETVVNKNCNYLSELYAMKAVELLAKYLPVAVKDGKNKEAREKVALANSLAGFVMQCTSEHTLEHSLSAFHPNLPHGAGLIMISLAYHGKFIEKHACDERYIQMAKVMGIPDANKAEDFLVALENMQNACGVGNLKMSDFGIDKSELKKFTENCLACSGGDFTSKDRVKLTKKDVLEIYEKSFR